MTDKLDALVRAAREYEGAVYADLPATNDRVTNAQMAVGSVVQAVITAMGLRGNVRIARPTGGLRWEKDE